MASLNEISTAQLNRLIGTPEMPVLLDLRIDEDFDLDPRVIPTAVRRDFRAVADWAGEFTGRKVVTSCQKGLKLSHGTAAWLRSVGIEAEALEGGHVAWVAADLPLVPVAACPTGPWVTRHRPKIDRIACPWLIRRFVDPSARFLFVPPAEVLDVADRFKGTPFDVENVAFSHRGEACTFDVMLETFGLATEPLQRLATIVRGADTDRHDLAPQAAGLLAISVGLSRMYRDDLAQLEAGMTLYDALYRWARDGVEEGHDWPGHRGAK